VSRLARLLVLFLVPVVIIAGPMSQGAQAATKFSTMATKVIHWDDTFASPPDDFWCSLSVYWGNVNDTVSLHPTIGRCEAGAVYDWYWAQGGSVELVFTGSGCPTIPSWATSLVLPSGGHDADDLEGQGSQSLGITGTYATLQTCNVTHVCAHVTVDLEYTSNGGGDTCFDLAVGLPPSVGVAGPTSGTCSGGTVTRPAPQDSVTYHEGWLPNGSGVNRNWNNVQYISTKTQGNGTGTWWPYVVVDHSGAGSYSGSTNWRNAEWTSNAVAIGPQAVSGASTVIGPVVVPYVQVATGTNRDQITHWPVGEYGVNAAGGEPVPWPARYGTVVGAGYIWKASGAPTTDLAVATSASSTGKVGQYDPSRCAFYWGAKVADYTGSTTDEPAGPMGAVVPDDPTPTPCDPEAVSSACYVPPDNTGCDFKFTDPSTWAAGGMCAAVGLLAQIGQYLGSAVGLLGDIVTGLANLGTTIATAIVDALSDLLSALFIPSPGFLDGKVADVQDAWADTPVGDVSATVADVPGIITVPTSSGCSGPSITIGAPGMGSATVHPLDACTAPASTFANILRTGLQAAVWISAMLLGLRFVLAGVGYSLTWGQGRDE
jgi:hypothetical protein